ncbi:reverse transcriptase [Elysia marginata]|uniref:Reverse transcriptase n=1 Tax=Elysia marginata TaxID=1093978 RepID=A0AAV4FR22_9GAST|nr:reverse transcriptase [Elysia marginata]
MSDKNVGKSFSIDGFVFLGDIKAFATEVVKVLALHDGSVGHLRGMREINSLSGVAMNCRKAKLKLPMKSLLEDYKGEKARLVTILEENGARGFARSSVYNLLSKLSISGNKRIKAFKLPAEKQFQLDLGQKK